MVPPLARKLPIWESAQHRRSSAAACSHVRLGVACAATRAIGSDSALIVIITIRSTPVHFVQYFDVTLQYLNQYYAIDFKA